MNNQILIIFNNRKSTSRDAAASIKDILIKKGYSVFLQISGEKNILENSCNFQAEKLFLIITIGGDGTVLGALRDFPRHPILALAAGRVGFITETPLEEWEMAFDEFASNNGQLCDHFMFEVSVSREGKEVFRQIGLNEIVVGSKGISRLVELFVMVNNKALGCFRADGVLVATPTGSTAYSAAAGGPVLSPEVEAFIINPLCAFSLSSRPIVVGKDSEIAVLVQPSQQTALALTVDGQVGFDLEESDKLIIKKAFCSAKIIKNVKRNFFEVLAEKLHWSGGAL